MKLDETCILRLSEDLKAFALDVVLLGPPFAGRLKKKRKQCTTKIQVHL